MNKSIFKRKHIVPQYDTVNEAGGQAYKLSDKEALAQLAVTGTFNDVFYVSGEDQLDQMVELAGRVDAGYLANVAVYAAENGLMKDAPAVLLAVLAMRSDASNNLVRNVFNRVIRTGKMLSNLVAIFRSGALGRNTIPRPVRRMINDLINGRDPEWLWRANIGVTDPSMGDIIKMTHPRGAAPGTQDHAVRELLLGRPVENLNTLPDNIADYENFKRARLERRPGRRKVPNVPFRALTALDLTDGDWVQIAKDAPWTMTRMNLNTFERHGVFNVEGMTDLIANRLANPELVEKAAVFPYQLLTTYKNTTGVPAKVRNALQDAMEIATRNVPALKGKTAVIVDVSGSMGSAVTGYRPGATTTTTCLDVAALVAACIFRTSDDCKVIPVDTSVHQIDLNPRDSVMTIARQLAAFRGGGTALGEAFSAVDRDTDNVIIVSDNESWADHRWYRGSTTVAQGFAKLKKTAKMVCIDIQPYTTTQAQTGKRILNVGGFSDTVFTVMDQFLNRKGSWVDLIESTILD